jgi:hypothetical protein
MHLITSQLNTKGKEYQCERRVVNKQTYKVKAREVSLGKGTCCQAWQLSLIPGPSGLEERVDSCKWSSDFHMSACAYTYKQFKSFNTHFLELDIPRGLQKHKDCYPLWWWLLVTCRSLSSTCQELSELRYALKGGDCDGQPWVSIWQHLETRQTSLWANL